MKTNRIISMPLACLAGACLCSLQATAGVLIGSQASAPASVNLTAEGTLDWAHWGLTNPTDFDQKSGVANQISNFTQITGEAANAVDRFDDAAVAYSWSDGMPTASAAGTTTGIYVPGLTNGFQFTVPANTTSKYLRVYAGGWNAQVHFEATLSDGSAAAYVDETLDDYGSGSAAVYTIKYAANSAGQTLTIRIYSIAVHDPVGGNCTLMGASLGTPPPGPTVMGVSTQVQNVTVYNGSEASFSFAATNNAAPPPASSCQWYKNNQPVTDATGTQFTFLTGPSDTNAQVHCVATLPAVFNPNNLSLTSATGTVTLLPCVIYTNGLKVEFFSGASRQDVEAGNDGPATSISLASSFEMPANDGLANYTRRVSGYFIPPTSGDYVFFICSDDDGDLFLSTDSDPTHKRLIAQEENWSDPRQWFGSGGGSALSQKVSDTFSPDGGLTHPYSTGIPLEQGHLYYLEGVQHQGIGGDNFAASYKLIGDEDPLDGDAPMLQAANHNIALMTSPTTNLVWVTQPVNVTNFVDRTVTFTSSANSDSEFQLLYQWYKNNSPVSGATAGSYSFPASLADNNTRWYVTASMAESGLSISSAGVTLTVKAAAFPQRLITFEDQNLAGLDTDFAMQPNPYTDVQGLPAGLTATFTNFNSWNADPQHTPGGTWLLYGSALGPNSAVLFNMPVQVPSLWVTTGPYGTVGSSLKGYLKGIEQFTYTNTAFNTLVELTNGARVLIDSIIFSDYEGSEIDDITIVKPATLITFSNQVGNDGPANPNPYTGAQGLWPGVTVTFDQFNNWKGSQDHTPDTTDNYLLYGANYDEGGVSSMTFNASVEVSSLWVSTEGGGQPGKATLKGYLKDVEQFTYTLTAGGWVEMTAGAGKPIDSIRFIDYGDSWIDDINVQAVTNPPVPPAQMSLTRNGAGALILSWTGQGRLYESLAVIGGWGISANQANPQNVSVTTGARFYRLAK